MRFALEKERRGYLLRCWHRHVERAWLAVKLCGFAANIETPSDRHEERLIWLHIGLGVCSLGVSLPWSGAIVPDNGHCSGPRYGFQFFEDIFWIYYGNDKSLSFYMPWHWKHRWHREFPETKQTHPYTYILRSGEIQQRTATIQREERLWTRFWIPWRKLSRSIDVQFSDEVGEETGSWKGGTIGCGYELKSGELPMECLRRMELERKF